MRASVDLATVLARIDAIERGVNAHDCRACRRAAIGRSLLLEGARAVGFVVAGFLALSVVVLTVIALALFVVGGLLAVGAMVQAWPFMGAALFVGIIAYALFRACRFIDRRL